jgi:hypothetical protein
VDPVPAPLLLRKAPGIEPGPLECVKNNLNGDLTLKLFNDVVLTTVFV